MSSTVVNSLTDVFRSQALAPFAARSGENEASLLRGFEASIGTMLTGLASKTGQSGFGRQVLDLINNPANDAHVLQNARTLVEHPSADGLGSKFISLLFGGNLSAITESIGRVSGLRTGTAASLMSLGAPLLLGSLMQRIRGMDSSSVTKFFSDEAAGVRGSLPEGVPLLIGSSLETVPPVATGVVPEKKSTGWIWPALLVAAAIVGLILWSSLHKPSVQTAIAWADRTLPGNVGLRIPAGKMEDHLIAFIQGPLGITDPAAEFDFDRLLFDSDSATLQPASQEQLQNIAAILKAYPNVHVKISGYTDNVGDATSNQTLSQQRADNVRQELSGMGISADRLEAQGYGEQNPVADNATAEGRQKNRRISLRVTQK